MLQVSKKVAWSCTRWINQCVSITCDIKSNKYSTFIFCFINLLVMFQDTMAKVGGRILFRTVTILTVMLPLFGFIVCVAWSLIFDFKSSTATHCGLSISGIFFFLPYIWFCSSYCMCCVLYTGAQLPAISISCNRGLSSSKICLEICYSIAYNS